MVSLPPPFADGLHARLLAEHSEQMPELHQRASAWFARRGLHRDSTLYVTLNTLRTHTKRIFTKLDVTTRAAAVRRARERGLL